MSSQELQEQTNRASELSCLLGWDSSAPPEAIVWDLLPSADNSLTPRPASHSSSVAIQTPAKSLSPWTPGAAALGYPAWDLGHNQSVWGKGRAGWNSWLWKRQAPSGIQATATRGSRTTHCLWRWGFLRFSLHTCHPKAGWPFSNLSVPSRFPLSPPPPSFWHSPTPLGTLLLCWELLLVPGLRLP